MFNYNTSISETFLIFDTILRNKIYNSKFWKQQLSGVNEETIIDLILKLKYVGGTKSSYKKPTKYICIILKLLHMKIDKNIIMLYLTNDNIHLKAVAAFYIRLVSDSESIYKILEPLFNNYTNILYLDESDHKRDIGFDELIELLLFEEEIFAVKLPRLVERNILVKRGILKKYSFKFEDEL